MIAVMMSVTVSGSSSSASAVNPLMSANIAVTSRRWPRCCSLDAASGTWPRDNRSMTSSTSDSGCSPAAFAAPQ